MQTAKDVMTTRVVTIKPSAKVYELTKLLSDHKISGVPVVDDDGQVVGIATEADLLAIKRGNTVGDIMTKEVISVTEDTPIQEIAAVLSAKRIKRVPVVKGGQLVGIVSRADLVAAIAKS
jgi:CBS domain-containing protein